MVLCQHLFIDGNIGIISTDAILVESAFYYFIHWKTEEIKQNINK